MFDWKVWKYPHTKGKDKQTKKKEKKKKKLIHVDTNDKGIQQTLK